MIYCQKCGTAANDSQNFCENCGAALSPNQPRKRNKADIAVTVITTLIEIFALLISATWLRFSLTGTSDWLILAILGYLVTFIIFGVAVPLLRRKKLTKSMLISAVIAVIITLLWLPAILAIY